MSEPLYQVIEDPFFEHPYFCEGWDWLDGPELAEWLEQYVPPSHDRPRGMWVESLRRRMSAWKGGVGADFYYLDAYLPHLGLHPVDVPAHIWRDTNRYQGLPYDEETRKKALAAYEMGMPSGEICQIYGPTRDTILRWRRQERKAA
jgi:hypothetical protein